MSSILSENPIPRPMVCVVDSDFTGEVKAREGVAERLNACYSIVPLPNGNMEQYGDDLADRYRTHKAEHGNSQFILISGTGEDTVSALADMKIRFGDDLVNVYLASILPDTLNPRLFEYDIIASPQMDDPVILPTLGVAHKVTHQRIRQAAAKHQHIYNNLRRPLFALLLGGNTMYCKGFDERYVLQLAAKVREVVSSQQGSLIITNSRRTPDDALKALLAELQPLEPGFFDWTDSPIDIYWSMLGSADVIIASGDSLSMCSEVLYTGKPLLVDINVNATECYHRDILKRLIDYGAARHLEQAYVPWTYEPVDTTGLIADAIIRKISNWKCMV